MLAIKNNIMAANAARYLGRSYDALATSVERLSSGLRINSAKDDAAGMAVRELMRADIAVIEQGTRNAQDGVSMLQTMEGAMATIDNALVRMKQLAEQASTGSYSSAQRIIMNSEFTEMAEEIERIAKTTEFNGIRMLDNTTETGIRFGVATDDEIKISGADMTQAGLGITTGTAGFEAMSRWGAATLDDAFLTFIEDGTGDDTVDFSIQFTGGATPEIAVALSYDVASAETEQITLRHIVDDINRQAGYAMATAQFDAGTNRYYLKLESKETDAAALTFDISSTSTDVFILDEGLALDLAGETSAMGADYAFDGGATMEVGAGKGLNILTAESATAALDTIGDAIGLKDTARAAFGYKINRLESTGEVLAIQMENLMAAESRISDVDVATEMAELTRNQVLAQAGTAMLAQANSIPQMALGLLR